MLDTSNTLNMAETVLKSYGTRIMPIAVMEFNYELKVVSGGRSP